MGLALGHTAWWEWQGLLTFRDREQNGTAGKGQLLPPRLWLFCAASVHI